MKYMKRNTTESLCTNILLNSTDRREMPNTHFCRVHTDAAEVYATPHCLCNHGCSLQSTHSPVIMQDFVWCEGHMSRNWEFLHIHCRTIIWKGLLWSSLVSHFTIMDFCRFAECVFTSKSCAKIKLTSLISLMWH